MHAPSENYMQDSLGRLVPMEQVRDVDKMRDALVREKAAKIRELQGRMKLLKEELFNDIEAFNAARILALRRHDIDDPRWQRAMAAIGESLQVRGNTAYVRLYEQDRHGKMQAVSLDFAAL